MDIRTATMFLEGRKPKVMEMRKHCAVLIPLVWHKDELYLLLEVRSGSVSQPGEICFPGGGVEGKERPMDCVIRETQEETGIPKHAIRILGQFDSMCNYTNMQIDTFVGAIAYQDVCNAIPNEEEVSELFLVPLKFFEENEPYIYEYEVAPNIGEDFPYDQLGDCPDKYNWRRGKFTVPIYHYDGKVIWGLTARIIRHFLAEMPKE
ncbi:MAG: CoA pyrophosphatase [Firmicutes bacterium]|nr:CoA pyrophosphatase [Bacillota bacterium]